MILCLAGIVMFASVILGCTSLQVHERSMDMDFVLTLLRHALPSRPKLKAF